MTTTTKIDRVLDALKEGQQLTAKQIQSRFGVGNARSTVSALRMKGYAIYANPKVDAKGRSTTKYRLGTPTRAVIAAGYKSLAASA